MKKSIHLKNVPTLITPLLFFGLPCFGCTSKKVQRADDTEYVILMITDLHFYKGKKAYARRAFKTMDDLVRLSSPDFIIVTGDVVNTRDDNDKIFKAFGERMESYKIPWTFTFGNHDVGGMVWDKDAVADYLESLEYCKFRRGPADVCGYGNNYFNVTDKSGKIIQTIFTIDTSGTGKEGDDARAIDQTQIEWYTRTVREIATEANGDPSKVVPSLMFTHIPMREYEKAYAEAEKNGEVIYGRRGEKECPADKEDDLFETILSLGSTKAYYCGHEHRNNYVVNKDGIRLSYGECCKQKSYIPTRGGLVINVKKDGKFTQMNITSSQSIRNYKVSKEY